MIIDIAAHYIPRSIQRMFAENPRFSTGATYPFPPGNADPEVRLGLMEKYGIDMQALLAHNWITPPVRKVFSEEEQEELRRRNNRENFSLCKAYPGKFVNICAFSLLDMKLALDELKRCVQEFDCRAVCLATNHLGKGLDTPEFLPFFERVAEHDLPVYLHPTDWESCYPLVDMATGWRMMHVFGWPFDTTQAVWRLIFGGVLDRFPTLKVITHHLGAFIPYFSRRVEINQKMYLSKALPRPITEYWKNLYGDTAMDGTRAAYPCGLSFFGPDRMLFGTDYPYGLEEGEDFIRENLAGIREMTVSEEIRKKILGGNARRLLRIA
jgi:predicted TIM-barrel fold metal-dependent hydrolase